MNNTAKKKILFLITKSNWGGAQRYVYDLATHVDSNLFEVVVALGGNGELKTQLENAGIRAITLQSLNRDISIKKEIAFARELFALVKNERPDILHVNSSKAGGIGTLIGRICHVPKVIFTAHGWAFNEDRPNWQKFVIKILHYITIMLSHRTIMVSEALLKQLPWLGVEKRAKIIYLGRTIGAMFSKEEARVRLNEILRLESPITDKEVWVGTIGELHPIKRQKVLIESMIPLLKTQPNLRLFIIGDGELRDKLQQQINASGQSRQIILTGALSDAARFLKALDIFVLCSQSEAYGYVAHEAGLAAVATIVTNVGGLPEIVENKVSGLIVPNDNPVALQAAITKLINDPITRQTFADAHYQRMSARTLEKMVRATEAIYTL